MTVGTVLTLLRHGSMAANDQKCSDLWWACVLLAVESYGVWGKEGKEYFSLLASHLAVHTSSSKSKATFNFYSRLNLALVRGIARAIMSKAS